MGIHDHNDPSSLGTVYAMTSGTHPSTYQRFKGNFSNFRLWLNAVHKVTISLSISMWEARGFEIPENITLCLEDVVELLDECIEWYGARQNLAQADDEEHLQQVLQNHDQLRSVLGTLRDALGMLMIARSLRGRRFGRYTGH